MYFFLLTLSHYIIGISKHDLLKKLFFPTIHNSIVVKIHAIFLKVIKLKTTKLLLLVVQWYYKI